MNAGIIAIWIKKGLGVTAAKPFAVLVELIRIELTTS